MKYVLGFILGWGLILLCVLQQWLLLAWCITVLFSLRYPTHSLVVMGILVDGYFGGFYGIPYFSLMALLWFIVVESMRDHLNVAQDNDVY